jgi:hypothetical protein
MIVAPDGDVTKPCLTMDVTKSGSNYYPIIGAQIPTVSWQKLQISPDTTCNTTIGWPISQGNNGFNTDLYGTVNISSTLTVPYINSPTGRLIKLPPVTMTGGSQQFATFGINSLYTTHVSGHVNVGSSPTISATDTSVSVSGTSTGIYTITALAGTVMNAVVSIADTTGCFFISSFASANVVTVYIFNSSTTASDLANFTFAFDYY